MARKRTGKRRRPPPKEEEEEKVEKVEEVDQRQKEKEEKREEGPDAEEQAEAEAEAEAEAGSDSDSSEEDVSTEESEGEGEGDAPADDFDGLPEDEEEWVDEEGPDEEDDDDDDEEEEEPEQGEDDDGDDDDRADRRTPHRDAPAPAPAPAPPRPSSSSSFVSDGRYRNKQRCLVLCSRGVTARYRHLLEDLRTLIPHHKKESKLDPGRQSDSHGGGGGVGRAVNDVAEARGCNSVLFLECRKRTDAYLWVGRVGPSSSGPSARFHLTNVHTMDELRLTGNCMRGSRPILTFDGSFEEKPHLRLVKALFVDVFGTPRGHPKSKPFVDRVMGFYYADGKIWVRNYQILHSLPANARDARAALKSTGGDDPRDTSLVEIGPRFVLDPVRIFRGSFGGQTLYCNPDFVNPNQVRAAERRETGRAYEDRVGQRKRRRMRREGMRVPEDPLDSVFR